MKRHVSEQRKQYKLALNIRYFSQHEIVIYDFIYTLNSSIRMHEKLVTCSYLKDGHWQNWHKGWTEILSMPFLYFLHFISAKRLKSDTFFVLFKLYAIDVYHQLLERIVYLTTIFTTSMPLV